MGNELEGVKDGDELELFPLRDGFFLVGKLPASAAKAEPISRAGEHALTGPELAVLRKLSDFRFEERIPADVNKTLSPAERAILTVLIEKKSVTIYSGGKYGKTGVYNIPKEIYPLLRISPAGPEQQQRIPPVSSLEHLNMKGYMVIENENEAKRAVSILHEQIKLGEIIGVRAFDHKFYVATRAFFMANEGKVHKALTKEGKSVDDVAASIRLPQEAGRVLLTLMSDSGDILEKKRGLFATA